MLALTIQTPSLKNAVVTHFTIILFFLAVLYANTSQAYTARTFNGCTPITFDTPPNVVLHTSEMDGFNIISSLQLLDAMTDIHDQFNEIGGISTSISTFTLSTDPFIYKTWFNDATPTIHVGFTSNASAAPGSTFWNVDASSCNILEAHIQIQNPSVFSTGWHFTEPSDEPWYMAGLTASDGRYFRIAYVHELLHAFGLAHSVDGFAMLNYGDRTWINRPYADKIKPLPDDIEGLRDLYPDSSTRTEIALLNSWYDPDNNSGGSYPAAQQDFLCAPSTGSTWGNKFDTACGNTGVTEICPGDKLYTRVAVANYGTDAVDVDMNLWFSTDDSLEKATDIVAAQTRSFSLGAQSSSQQGRVYYAPYGLAYNTEYFVIVNAVANEQSSTAQSEDWNPLRGTIRTKTLFECKIMVPVTLP